MIPPKPPGYKPKPGKKWLPPYGWKGDWFPPHLKHLQPKSDPKPAKSGYSIELYWIVLLLVIILIAILR